MFRKPNGIQIFIFFPFFAIAQTQKESFLTRAKRLYNLYSEFDILRMYTYNII